MQKYLVPFSGRNKSGAYNLNFLWKKNNFYIMDNHRAALWCWMQHVKTTEKYNFLHIDQHYDTMASQLSKWMKALPNLESITINEYLDYKYTDANCSSSKYPLFRYDNYLTIFFDKYSHLLNQVRFLTQREGDKPNINYTNLKYYHCLGNLDYWLESDNENHIVNIDLDFFFREFEGNDIQIFSDDYIEHIAESLNKIYKLNRIEVITVAMSPEFCDGWSKSEKILSAFLKPFDVNFTLK